MERHVLWLESKLIGLETGCGEVGSIPTVAKITNITPDRSSCKGGPHPPEPFAGDVSPAVRADRWARKQRQESFLFKITLGCAAHRANPVLGEVLEFRSGGDAVVGVTDRGVVNITANRAYVSIHSLSFLLRLLVLAGK